LPYCGIIAAVRPTSGTLAALLAAATITGCSRPATPARSSAADARVADPGDPSRPVRARLEQRPDEPDDDINPCPGPAGADVPDDLRPTATPAPDPGVARSPKPPERG
jgi:hypothetical protein